MGSEAQDDALRQRLDISEVRLDRIVSRFSTLLRSEDVESHSCQQLLFLEDLKAMRHYCRKLQSVARSTCEVEIRSYQREFSDIEEQRGLTKTHIETLKRRLEEVKVERKNKLEYDIVAAEIIQLPTRADLVESLDKLTEQLQQVQAENAKYASMSRSAAERMSDLAGSIDALHADIGYEVGERERREVERVDGEADIDTAEAAPSRAGDREEGEEREHRSSATPIETRSLTPRTTTLDGDPSSSALNASAPVFRPSTSSATAASTPRSPRPKRDSTALAGSDEEGELQDTSVAKASTNNSPSKNNSNDDTPRKRKRYEE